MAHRLPRLAAAVLLALTSTACPDDSVPTTPLPGGLDLAGLLPAQQALVRATLEISGGALAETELDLDDELLTLSGTFDVQNVTAATDRELQLRVYGRFAEDSEEVLLGRLVKPITLQPEADVAIAFSADDTFDSCGGEPGACGILFDANRNGASNIDDLLERERSAGLGIDPAPQAPYLVTSSEQLQFPSGVRLGSFARQLVVLENFGDNAVEITSAAVVGGQGFAISILDPTGQSVAPPGRALTGDTFQGIAPGQEAFIAVSFTPVNSFVTTGALFVRVRDTVTLVEQTARVKLIANPEGELRPADLTYTEPALDAITVDGGQLELVAFPNAQLQSGDALIAEDALGAGLRQTGASVAIVDGDVTVDFPADAAFAVTVRAGERFSTAIDGLTSDVDIAVVDITDGAIGALACADCRSANAGTSPEAVEFKNDDPEPRTVAVLIGRIEPVGLPETDGGLTVAETVSFRCSTTLSIGPEFAEVDPVQPTTGPLEGGIPVRLRGSGFDPRARVFVGQAEALDVAIETDADGVDVVTFTLPAAVGTDNPASIFVENPKDPGDGQAATLLESFTYQPPAPVIDEIRPDLAPTTGGDTTVTVIGRFFSARHGEPLVSFGTVTVPATFVSASELTLTAPPHVDVNTAATVSVKVRNRIAADVDGAPVLGSASNGVAFRYLVPAGAAPTIVGVTPAVGSVDGGTRVSVEGTDIRAGVRVFFGGREADCDTPTSTTAVSCLTPAADNAVAVDVIVVNADAQSAKRDNGYRYEIPAPSIASVFPPRGITDGGTFLVVEGGGFRPGARVTFVQGETFRDATAATRVSGTTMLVTTPPGTAGAADLVIRNLDGQSVTGAFTYFAPDQATPPPSITALSPAVGDAAGGYPVVITGTGFLNPSVLFGSRAVEASFVDRTPPELDELTVVAPPSPTGVASAVTVQVINDDGQSATNGFNYTFSAAAPPRIDRIAPSTFTSGQTTPFTIFGARFDAGAIVLVGGLQANITARSSSSISATISGQLPLGAVQVVVENPGGTAVSIPVQVVSAAGVVQPAITAMSTSDVHADVAGDIVTLFGAGLDQGQATVQVAAVGQADPPRPARVLVQNPNFLVVELPAIPPGRRVLQATLETPAGTRTALSPTVTAHDPIIILANGESSVDGRLEVAMFGDFFNPAALRSITLDNAVPITCDITVATERAIRCTTTTAPQAGRVYDLRLAWAGTFNGASQPELQRSAASLGFQEPIRGPSLEVVTASDAVRGFTDFGVVSQTLIFEVPGIEPSSVPAGATVEVIVGSRGDPAFSARGDGIVDFDTVTTTLDSGVLGFAAVSSVPVTVVVDGGDIAFGFVEGVPRLVAFNNQAAGWPAPITGQLDNELAGDRARIVVVREPGRSLVLPVTPGFQGNILTLDTRSLAPGEWRACLSDQVPFCANSPVGTFFVNGRNEELEPNNDAGAATGINPFGQVSGLTSLADPDNYFFRLDTVSNGFVVSVAEGCQEGLAVELRRRATGAFVADGCLPSPQVLIPDEYLVTVSTVSSEPRFYNLTLTPQSGTSECNGNGTVEPGEECDESGSQINGCDALCREFGESADAQDGLLVGLAPTVPLARTLTPFDIDRFTFDVEQGGQFLLQVISRQGEGCGTALANASLEGPPGFIAVPLDGLGCVSDERFLPPGRYRFSVEATNIPLKYSFVVEGGSGSAICGNGVIEAGETCDDQNLSPDDGCSAVCAVEPGFSCVSQPSFCSPISQDCSNGVLDPGESCDEGAALNGQPVAVAGFGQVLCAADCSEPVAIDMAVTPQVINVARTITPFDVEFIRVVVPQRSELNVFTTFRNGGEPVAVCDNRIKLTILDPQFQPLTTSVDGNGGCAFAQAVVPPGTYTARIEAVQPDDTLRFIVGAFLEPTPLGEVCGDGTEFGAPQGAPARTTLSSNLQLFGGVGAGLAVDNNDVVFAIENEFVPHRIRRRDPNGDERFLATGAFSAGADLEVGPDGFLYLADGGGFLSNGAPSSNRVVRINPGTGVATTFIDSVLNPSGLAFGADGMLYVAEFDTRRILRFDAGSGLFIDTFVNDLGVVRPMDLEFGPEGQLFVAGFDPVSFSPQTVIFEVNASGIVSPFVDTGLADPHSLAVDKGGNLWATMYNGAELVRVTPDGVIAFSQAEPGPNGIAIGRDGALYLLLNTRDIVRQTNLAFVGAEECDDGGVVDDDGCSARCRVEGDIALGIGQDTTVRGGGGGAAFRDLCDTGSVLVGVFARATSVVSSVGAVCARTRIAGEVVDVVDRYRLELRGPGSGPLAEARCPAGSAVVAFSGNAGQLVDALEFGCAPVTNGAGLQVGGRVANSPRIGGGGGVPFAETACPAGQIARGINVRAGADVDAFGIVCGTLP